MQGFNFQTDWSSFCIPALLLALALGVSFWKLSSLNQQVKGIFCNDRLMMLHYLSFFLATAFDTVSLILQSVITTIKENHNDKEKYAEIQRINIALNTFSTAQQISWFVCQVIMLIVFVRYGRPVEPDAMALFQKKLEAVY